MNDRERERTLNSYEESIRHNADRNRHAMEGRVVIDAEAAPLEETRQGRLRFYLHPIRTENAVTDWKIIWNEIHTHTGRHTHQGGLYIYVVAGKGYTIVDGKRVDWEAGDMILLPIKPEGVDHQHFNEDPNVPAEWVAFIYTPWKDFVADVLEQKENAPGYRG